MAQRKEVFQSKVFQKLYPTASTLKDTCPPHVVETLTDKTHKKRKASKDHTPHVLGNAEKKPSGADPGRRMYTVLPPPPDYEIDLQESVTQTSVEDPAEENVPESEGSLDEESEAEEQKLRRRRRRKRKKKGALHLDPGNDGSSSTTVSATAPSGTPAEEGGERISRNKKRKLKKKRHREKLLSTGLMPRAAALEFTYQKEGGEEEEEDEDETEAKDEQRKAAEVSEFLRTTMEIYVSDTSLHAAKAPHLSAAVDNLLGSVASGDRVLRQLYNLKVFVQHRDTNELEKALEELTSSSVLSAGETAAVVSLFQYWITDILPMQGDKKTEFSTTPS